MKPCLHITLRLRRMGVGSNNGSRIACKVCKIISKNVVLVSSSKGMLASQRLKLPSQLQYGGEHRFASARCG